MTGYATQIRIQNPHATKGLLLTIDVLCNTPDASIAANVQTNSALDLDWLTVADAHAMPIVIVGGGPSAADNLAIIKEFSDAGVPIMALNGASRWLHEHGIGVDVQFMIDPQQASADLLDPGAESHLLASQVHPDTVARAVHPMLVHLMTAGIEDHLPPERRALGGYALIGGGVASGNSALCVAYALGHRRVHLFGYDSSHRGAEGHAYAQPQNETIPTITTEFDGVAYRASIAMKAQADVFMILASQLEAMGCTITVYGDGLLPAMYRARQAVQSERDKYELMWKHPAYRIHSPGKRLAEALASHLEPGCEVLDIGCGTGQASVALAEKGFRPILLDLAANCRDAAAEALPFHVADLGQPLPVTAAYGICCDVMEHIPPSDVDAVLANIARAVTRTALFAISFEPDSFGDLIGKPLHLSVHPAEWWADQLSRHFASVVYDGALFICSKSSVETTEDHP